MKASSLVKMTSVAVACAFVLAAVPAQAQTKSEGKCLDAIGKGLGGVVKAYGKNLAGCLKGGGGAGCATTAGADAKNKLPKTIAKFTSAVGGEKSKCESKEGVEFAAILAAFEVCPSPHDDITIADFGDVADCILAHTTTVFERDVPLVTGTASGLGKDEAKCQGAIVKGLAKLIDTTIKERAGCIKNQTKNNGEGPYPGFAACRTADAKGKIAGATQKLKDGIAKSCNLGARAVSDLGACGDSVAELQDCAADGRGGRIGAGIVGLAYGIPSSCTSLGSVAVSINPGNNVNTGDTTNTELSVGWNGLGHGVDVIADYEGRVDISCNDAACTDCTPTIAYIKDEPNAACRCGNDATIACDTINGIDEDDCGAGNQCNCMFGPPLALQSSNTPVCVVNRIVEELNTTTGGGSADIGRGESTTSVTTRALVHLGVNKATPCATCDGDTTANDGNRNGTCSTGSARAGMPCDENGRHFAFGPVSYDCQPIGGQNISGAGIGLNLVLSSDPTTTSLDATDNLCSDNTSDCACRVCSGDQQVGCSTNDDCDVFSAGTCTALGPEATQQNACSDSTCDASGLCLAGPFTGFCDGFVRGSGKGIFVCGDNDDCGTSSANSPFCPGNDCGTCQFEARPCFGETIGFDSGDIDNDPSINGADLSSTFCSGRTGNQGINEAAGSPGPSTLMLDFSFEGRCASDGDVAWAPPIGANCP